MSSGETVSFYIEESKRETTNYRFDVESSKIETEYAVSILGKDITDTTETTEAPTETTSTEPLSPEEEKYQEAQSLVFSSKFDEAYQVLNTIADYKNAKEIMALLENPLSAVMIGTGLRVGETTGPRWCDIDLEEGMVNVNHTLVYYDHHYEAGCRFHINTPKTKAGERVIPMMEFVKEAFLMEKAYQEEAELTCKTSIDGYRNFIFINRFGEAQHLGTLNKSLCRIVRDCNYAQFVKSENPEVLLPHISCHTLRHTFTTRMCEAGVNIKVIQEALDHADVSTTLGIYADVTKELHRDEFKGLDDFFKKSEAQMKREA